jgi:hypothetical protein
MWKIIEEQIPNWRQINGDPRDGTPPAPGWQMFLDTVEQFSGATYNELLQRAQQAKDGHRVATIFKQFLNQNQASMPAPPQIQAAGPQPNPQGLEQWVAPGQQAAMPAPVAASGQEVPWIKTSDITKFTDDVIKKRYAGREEEMRRREAEIFAAVAARRVRPG